MLLLIHIFNTYIIVPKKYTCVRACMRMCVRVRVRVCVYTLNIDLKCKFYTFIKFIFK